MSEELSGRSLDATVAERVFGMVWCRLNRRDTSVILRRAEDAPNYWPARDSDERVVESADNYSESIEAAWSVVERLQKQGYMVSVNASDAGGYWCCLYPPAGDFIESGTEETMPLAVVRAALKAVEQKNDTP